LRAGGAKREEVRGNMGLFRRSCRVARHHIFSSCWILRNTRVTVRSLGAKGRQLFTARAGTGPFFGQIAWPATQTVKRQHGPVPFAPRAVNGYKGSLVGSGSRKHESTKARKERRRSCFRAFVIKSSSPVTVPGPGGKGIGRCCGRQSVVTAARSRPKHGPVLGRAGNGYHGGCSRQTTIGRRRARFRPTIHRANPVPPLLRPVRRASASPRTGRPATGAAQAGRSGPPMRCDSRDAAENFSLKRSPATGGPRRRTAPAPPAGADARSVDQETFVERGKCRVTRIGSAARGESSSGRRSRCAPAIPSTLATARRPCFAP